EDGAGTGGVVLSARLVHVGDRRQAHFQPLVGVVELLLERRLGRFGGIEGLQRDQHVEVGVGGARDQLVRCRFQVVVRGAAVVALGPQVGDRAQVDQRLVELCVVAAPAGGAGNARGMVAVEAGRARDLRQQLRARLHRAFAGAQALRLGDRDLGIVGPRQLVGLHQVFGERRRAGQGEGEGKNQGAAEHRESLAYGGLMDQNRNSGGGAAPNRYGSSVSNNDSMRWSSTSLCSSTASIA